MPVVHLINTPIHPTMEDLIIRYIHGTLSAEECRLLWKAIEEDPGLIQTFEMLEALYIVHHELQAA